MLQYLFTDCMLISLSHIENLFSFLFLLKGIETVIAMEEIRDYMETYIPLTVTPFPLFFNTIPLQLPTNFILALCIKCPHHLVEAIRIRPVMSRIDVFLEFCIPLRIRISDFCILAHPETRYTRMLVIQFTRIIFTSEAGRMFAATQEELAFHRDCEVEMLRVYPIVDPAVAATYSSFKFKLWYSFEGPRTPPGTPPRPSSKQPPGADNPFLRAPKRPTHDPRRKNYSCAPDPVFCRPNIKETLRDSLGWPSFFDDHRTSTTSSMFPPTCTSIPPPPLPISEMPSGRSEIQTTPTTSFARRGLSSMPERSPRFSSSGTFSTYNRADRATEPRRWPSESYSSRLLQISRDLDRASILGARGASLGSGGLYSRPRFSSGVAGSRFGARGRMRMSRGDRADRNRRYSSFR